VWAAASPDGQFSVGVNSQVAVDLVDVLVQLEILGTPHRAAQIHVFGFALG
jgi:hypothetical protein